MLDAARIEIECDVLHNCICSWLADSVRSMVEVCLIQIHFHRVICVLHLLRFFLVLLQLFLFLAVKETVFVIPTIRRIVIGPVCLFDLCALQWFVTDTVRSVGSNGWQFVGLRILHTTSMVFEDWSVGVVDHGAAIRRVVHFVTFAVVMAFAACTVFRALHHTLLLLLAVCEQIVGDWPITRKDIATHIVHFVNVVLLLAADTLLAIW
mmetsp:Transcript_5405/g.9050  ORF Transcript_5405/g.9050 Transcript_5405/m.9050 type:complete len:208 (+) Transcript_5405:1274-1897(+)